MTIVTTAEEQFYFNPQSKEIKSKDKLHNILTLPPPSLGYKIPPPSLGDTHSNTNSTLYSKEN